jgi:hypothetical protein
MSDEPTTAERVIDYTWAVLAFVVGSAFGGSSLPSRLG